MNMIVLFLVGIFETNWFSVPPGFLEKTGGSNFHDHFIDPYLDTFSGFSDVVVCHLYGHEHTGMLNSVTHNRYMVLFIVKWPIMCKIEWRVYCGMGVSDVFKIPSGYITRITRAPRPPQSCSWHPRLHHGLTPFMYVVRILNSCLWLNLTDVLDNFHPE